MRIELGHGTTIEIGDGKPIMYVSPNGNVPLSLRMHSTAELPKAPTATPPKPIFKKIKYAGAD
jgi:hypothetical protein